MKTLGLNAPWMALASIALVASGAACSRADAKTFVAVEGYDIGFSFPSGWEKVTGKTPYDLQCTNGKSYGNVFAFHVVDLAKGQTALDIFRRQKDDLVGKRQNVEFLSDETTVEDAHTRVRSVLFSGEKDGSKNYYYANLVELKGQPDVFAWVLFTGTPSYAKQNLDVWKAIVASARPVKPSTPASR